MTAGIQAWLDAADPPVDLYDLLGTRCLEPDRDQLLRRIETGIAELLPHQNDSSAERAGRAVHLLQELNRARDTFSSSQRTRVYDEGLIALIRAKCAALPAGGSLQPDELRERLQRDFRVHPERLEEVLEAAFPRRAATSRAPGGGLSRPTLTARSGQFAESAKEPLDAQGKGSREGNDATPVPPPQPVDAPHTAPSQAPSHDATPGASSPPPRPPRPAPRTRPNVAGPRARSAGQPPPSPVSAARKGEPPGSAPMRHAATSETAESARRTAPATVGSSGQGLVWGLSALVAVLVVGGATAVFLPMLWHRNETDQIATPRGSGDQGARASDGPGVRDSTDEPNEAGGPIAEPTKNTPPDTPSETPPSDVHPKAADGSTDVPAESPPTPTSSPKASTGDTRSKDAPAEDTKLPPAPDPEKPPAGDTKEPEPASPKKPPGGAAGTPAAGGDAPLVLTHDLAATAAAWSPDATKLATTGMDRVVRVWNSTSGEDLHQLKGHAGPVNGLCWDQEGKRLASAGEDGTIRIWTLDGAESETLKPGDMAAKPLNAIAWRRDSSNDQDRLVVGTSAGALFQWMRRDVGPWRSSDLTADVQLGAVRSIRCDHGKRIQVASCHGDAAIVIREGTRVGRMILDGNSELWESVAEKRPRGLRAAIITPSDRNGCTGMDINDDGTLLAVASNGDLDIWSVAYDRFNVRLQIIPGYQERLDGYRAPDWSPDGKYLAAGDGTGRVVVWEVADGKVRKQRFQFKCPKPVVAVAWEPGTGHRVVAACEDGKVRIWNIDDVSGAKPSERVDGLMKQAHKFVEDESWEDLGRAVALLRSQVLMPTQKLTVDEFQAKLGSAADEILADMDIAPRRVTDEQRMELQAVIDLDPISDAAADALRLMQGKEPKIKREKKEVATAEPYAPVQATGPPNARIAMQDRAAWAPDRNRGNRAWLDLTFSKEVSPRHIEVHLTVNPQAAYSVALLIDRNPEKPVWVRNRRVRTASPLSIPLSLGPLKTREAKVYVDGPCQIDAVCLIDEDGNRHWAATATASSYYSGK